MEDNFDEQDFDVLEDEMIRRSDPKAAFEALQAVIAALQHLDRDEQRRVYVSAGTFLELTNGPASSTSHQSSSRVPRDRSPNYPSFSEDAEMTPKEFVLLKQPRTDVERIAVLAYYLEHYRDTPQFKTIDLSKLNTEAAQPKFSNASETSHNAAKQQYLVSTSKGQRQLSAAGEQFVNALPDREAAKAAMTSVKARRKPRKKTSKGTKSE